MIFFFWSKPKRQEGGREKTEHRGLVMTERRVKVVPPQPSWSDKKTADQWLPAEMRTLIRQKKKKVRAALCFQCAVALRVYF